MLLSVREVSELLGVSEKTIYRWIRSNGLPCLKFNEQYRFNRVELLEWATAHRVNVSADIFSEPDGGKAPIPGLADTIRAGGIHYRVGGTDRESVLKAAIEVIPLPDEVDKSYLLRVFMAREALGSTAIGNGIAIPHVRNPIVLHVPRPVIAVCFLEHPIEFGSLDGKPVHALFAMVSPTTSAHLNLLSKLAHALRQPEFAGVITRQGTRDEILDAAALIDRSVPRPAGATAGTGAAT